MEKPEQILSLKLPNETLSALRHLGICPEWFATEVIPGFVRDMLEDDCVLQGILCSWSLYKNVDHPEDHPGIGKLLCGVAAAA
jgi:hypothetical protein